MGIEIIAEIGINWQGDISMAKNMIWAAKGNGADVAKFQIYDPRRVLDRNDPVVRDHWDTILKTELTKDQVVMLKEECDKAGIEFLASVFRPEVVEWTEAIGMKRYKIASRSIYDEPLAKAIAATRRGKRIILSYGHWEWGRIPAISLYAPTWRIIRLWCVSKYPTPLKDIKLDYNMFKYDFDGFSDHTEGITAAVVAMSLGAKIIEKHVTFDKTLPGPDHCCSITFDELHRLCEMRDEIEEILGV